MKAQMILFAGTMAGLTLMAAPVLSQERPSTPGTQRPPSTPGQDRQDSSQFKQAMRMLEGSWQISVKTFGAGGADANANQMQGTSTRRWVLNQNILQEEVRTSGSAGVRGTDGNFQVREPGQDRPGGSMAANFEGHGMFGFDAQSNEFQHVWADSKDSKLSFSTGRFDERTRTFTFQKEGGMTAPTRLTPPATPPSTPPSTTPPSTPPRRPDSTPPSTPPGRTDPDDSLNMQVDPNQPPSAPPTPPRTPTTPSNPSTTQRPGSGGSAVDLPIVDRVVIRIQDENRHTVEYFGAGQTKLMEITYTKGASGAR